LVLVRRAALGTAAGAVVGLVVGGIWGRAFMALLAALNEEDHGTRTDDGFSMGQFTIGGTVNLAVVAAIGGLVFLVVRGLRFGPGWFRTTSVAVGATVVVGSLLVHSDGVDFSRVDPVALTVVLTLSMPLLYAVGVTWLGDRWLGSGPTLWDRLPEAAAWVARAGLAVIVLLAGVDLVRTIVDILDGNPFN
jgi:hypothetical protein